MTIGYIEGPVIVDTGKMDEAYFRKLLGLSDSWSEVYEVIGNDPNEIALRITRRLCRKFPRLDSFDSESVPLRFFELAVQKREQEAASSKS